MKVRDHLVKISRRKLMTKRYTEKHTKFEDMYILLAMWSRV